jgi:hypothetical protein
LQSKPNTTYLTPRTWKDIEKHCNQTYKLGCFEIIGNCRNPNTGAMYEFTNKSHYNIWVKMSNGTILENFGDYIRNVQSNRITLSDHVLLFTFLYEILNTVKREVGMYAKYIDEEVMEPKLMNLNLYVNILHFSFSCGKNVPYYDCGHTKYNAMITDVEKRRRFWDNINNSDLMLK